MLALVVVEVLLDALDFAVGDLPDRALELRPLGAAQEHADDIAVRPHVLEHPLVLGRLHLQELAVARGALLQIAAGDGAEVGEEVRHVALAAVVALPEILEERVHELAEQRLLGLEVQVERPLRKIARRSDVLDPGAHQPSPGELRASGSDERFLGVGVGGAGHASSFDQKGCRFLNTKSETVKGFLTRWS